MGVNTWTLCSPPGTAPITVLRLRGGLAALSLRNARGRAVCWPGPDEVRLAWLGDAERPLDQVLVVGLEGGADLHLHGSHGVLCAVHEWLGRHDFTEVPVSALDAPHGLRHARALLSARRGPMAELRAAAGTAIARGTVSRELAERVQRSLALERFAECLVTPPVVRIVGRENAGKSLLFNALVGVQRALVSPHAGTTRDTVRALVPLRGTPVELQDSAGTDTIEPAGPSVRLQVRLLDRVPESARDPGDGVSELRLLGRADERPQRGGLPAVSGLTGEGVAELLAMMADALGIPAAEDADLWAPVERGDRALLRAAGLLPVAVGPGPPAAG